MTTRFFRIALGFVTVGSVIFTPLVGVFGPFQNGQADTGSQALFLPAGYAFSIWAINYLGLMVLGIWQALPAQANNPRASRAAPWLALTAIGNVVWIILAGRTALVPWTVPTLIFMEITAWLAYLRLEVHHNHSLPRIERALHIPLQIYVGWLSVATVANTASALVVLNWDGLGLSPVIWTVIMLIVAVAVAGIIGKWVGNDNIYRGVFVWALIAIVVEQKDITLIAWVAGAAALLVALMIMFGRNPKASHPMLSVFSDK